VHLQLRDDGNPDEALKTIETCLAASKHIDLGKQRARVLQLLGEVHRIKGNVDQARGFLGSAGECARAAGDKCDEGWALLALAAVGYERGTSPDTPSRLELIRQAYDCFSAVYAAGDDDSRYDARDGFPACHSWRAEVLDHRRIDEALVEYGRAMDVYKEMGEDRRALDSVAGRSCGVDPAEQAAAVGRFDFLGATTIRASVMDGDWDLANAFEDTADWDRTWHFSKETEIQGLIGQSSENLRAAIDAEAREMNTFAQFAREAIEDGDVNAAAFFNRISRDKAESCSRLKNMVAKMDAHCTPLPVGSGS
jgi:tetratricopeptide (TPR) repeat protein